MTYDILILGGGPAGLSAAAAARQKGRTALVISNPSAFNPLYKAEKIDNYLGLPGLSGAQMVETFEAHARQMGAEFVTGKALNAMSFNGVFYLTVGSELYEGKKLILCAGISRGAKYPGETELVGKGVSYCATCDGMLYRNRPVVVIGRSKDA
ncbi:MAG: FAD-dependent oxidoreductase, partial [Oscillospiraceae bacterium]|nr:FAD-dependent oxidoreductase [Oscillospiraceae bacterium]